MMDEEMLQKLKEVKGIFEENIIVHKTMKQEMLDIARDLVMIINEK